MRNTLFLFHVQLSSVYILAICLCMHVCLCAVYRTNVSISNMCRYKNLRANIFFVLQYVTINFRILPYILTCTEQIPACGAGAGGGTAARDAGAGCAGLCVGADGWGGHSTGVVGACAAGGAAAVGHGAGGGPGGACCWWWCWSSCWWFCWCWLVLLVLVGVVVVALLVG